MEGDDREVTVYSASFKRHFWRPIITLSGNKQELVACAIGCPKMHFFPHTHEKKKWCKDTFFHPPVILANATVVALGLLRNSRFNFHCYTQRDATPTQKSDWKWQLWHFATSYTKDYKGHSLMQTSFAEPPYEASLKFDPCPLQSVAPFLGTLGDGLW